jgi:hypothetical protein
MGLRRWLMGVGCYVGEMLSWPRRVRTWPRARSQTSVQIKETGGRTPSLQVALSKSVNKLIRGIEGIEATGPKTKGGATVATVKLGFSLSTLCEEFTGGSFLVINRIPGEVEVKR